MQKSKKSNEFSSEKKIRSKKNKFISYLKRSRSTNLTILSEFLSKGASAEINIDGATMTKTIGQMKNPSRWTITNYNENSKKLGITITIT